MTKFKVVGDPNNKPFCSSEIIISNINKGAQAVGLYDGEGKVCVYDCLANQHGYNAAGILCAYETAIPYAVHQNANGKLLIGLSRQNQLFFTEGGYPKERTSHCLLGVDSKEWSPRKPKEKGSKFRFFSLAESNSRAAYDELLYAFGEVFGDNKEVELYIKDRWATDTFKEYVKECATARNIQVIHDDRHTTDREIEKELYASSDCHVFLNRSSTFALSVPQGMAMGIPTMTMDYSGPQDYCSSLCASIVEHTIEEITPITIAFLEAKGYKNFLFPPTNQHYPRPPRWAVPDMESLKTQLSRIYEDKDYRELIGYQGRVVAEGLTWERTAVNLSHILW